MSALTQRADIAKGERYVRKVTEAVILTWSPKALYSAAGVNPDSNVIAYGGRGYAAACGLLALKLPGHENARLYDGSWTEWSADSTLPVEV